VYYGVDVGFERLLGGLEFGDKPVNEVGEELRSLLDLLAELCVVDYYE
jgi:hypothetical protein